MSLSNRRFQGTRKRVVQNQGDRFCFLLKLQTIFESVDGSKAMERDLIIRTSIRQRSSSLLIVLNGLKDTTPIIARRQTFIYALSHHSETLQFMLRRIMTTI